MANTPHNFLLIIMFFFFLMCCCLNKKKCIRFDVVDYFVKGHQLTFMEGVPGVRAL